MKMGAELGFSASACGDADDGEEFSRFQVETGPRLYVSKDEFHNIIRHIRRNAGDIFNGLVAEIAKHLFEPGAAALVLGIVGHLFSLAD
jgi:hypothetical protein